LQAATEAPREVYEAARRDLRGLLASITSKNFRRFNFSSLDELQTATVGTPYPMFLVDRNAIAEASPEAPIFDVAKPASQWLFPVISDGKYCTILTVALMQGRWTGVEVGASDLAPEFSSVATRWPASQGYQCIFVRSEETFSEFVILLHQGAIQILPLPNAMKTWGLDQQRILNSAQAISFLKDAFSKRREP
jgi:hypothetical protein